MRIAKAIISFKALRHNLSLVKRIAHNKPIMVVLKANAYSHGITEVAKNLYPGYTSIGVASLQEAISLRQLNLEADIILLSGVNHTQAMQQAIENKVTLVVHNAVGLDLMMNNLRNYQQDIWLKVDTGMHRLGFDSSEFMQALEKLLQVGVPKERIVLMSHLSHADELDANQTQEQINQFKALTKNSGCRRCLANSAGILAWPEAHFDYVRSGLMIYGCSPLANTIGKQHQLQPAMSFESEVIAVKTVRKGGTVGYCGTWKAAQDTRIAVVSVGYGDGYPRHATNGTPVWIQGKEYPLVGRISMDMLTVEIGGDSIQVGDRVVLWGDELPIETIASFADTIPYELLCNITQRVTLVYEET
ncbi:MAG: alanine racemase [Pseudomonadota bacterium]